MYIKGEWISHCPFKCLSLCYSKMRFHVCTLTNVYKSSYIAKCEHCFARAWRISNVHPWIIDQNKFSLQWLTVREPTGQHQRPLPFCPILQNTTPYWNPAPRTMSSIPTNSSTLVSSSSRLLSRLSTCQNTVELRRWGGGGIRGGGTRLRPAWPRKEQTTKTKRRWDDATAPRNK